MRPEEAAWIGARLAAVPDPSPVLELGSSTRHFREVIQPHIEGLIHKPLRERGAKIVHADLVAGDGVDIAGDIFDPDVFARAKAAAPRSVICCNMFEHVADRTRLAQAIADLLPSGGHAVVTVPNSYPVHHDPIDTYFRPSPSEIAALFPQFVVADGEVISSITFGQRLMQNRNPAKAIAKRLLWLLWVWEGPRRYVERNHRLLWLFRPYKLSAVVLRKL